MVGSGLGVFLACFSMVSSPSGLIFHGEGSSRVAGAICFSLKQNWLGSSFWGVGVGISAKPRAVQRGRSHSSSELQWAHPALGCPLGDLKGPSNPAGPVWS